MASYRVLLGARLVVWPRILALGDEATQRFHLPINLFSASATARSTSSIPPKWSHSFTLHLVSRFSRLLCWGFSISRGGLFVSCELTRAKRTIEELRICISKPVRSFPKELIEHRQFPSGHQETESLVEGDKAGELEQQALWRPQTACQPIQVPPLPPAFGLQPNNQHKCQQLPCSMHSTRSMPLPGHIALMRAQV